MRSAPSPPLSPSLKALQSRLRGTEIGGYRVKRLIGYGGMGAVFEAEHQSLELRAAVKVLSFTGPHDRQAADAVKRFLDEAKALSAVRHSGLVRLYDSGQLPDGTVYMLMEYLAGEPLRARLARGRLPLDTALALLLQIASALCEVHDKGIVHRDLTPSNLLIVPDREAEGGERVKLLDFGIAKIRSGIETHTKTGECCGTPRYMAPEQCEGSAYINDRADIYTLGLLLFEMLAGRSPYAVHSGDALAWMFAHVSRRPQKLSELVPAVPPEIAELAAEMLDKVPAQRPSAAQVVQRLRRYSQLARRNSSSTDGNAELVLAPPAAGVRSRLAGLGQTERLWGLVALLTTGFCAVGFFGWRELGPAPGGTAVAARSAARAALAPSGMVLIRGQRQVLGSSAAEVTAALAECQASGDPACQRDTFEREQPERIVNVSSFYLDQKEVTNREYAAWLNRTPQPLQVVSDSQGKDRQLFRKGEPSRLLADLYFKDGRGSGLVREAGRYLARPGFAELPVVQVTWHGAREYCLGLGRDLPTEAQWERAARDRGPGPSGEPPRYPWGDEPPRCDGVRMAQLSGRCAGAAVPGPLPVGTAAQDLTPSGVFDLGGNVSEWVRDRFVAPYPDCGECLDPLILPGGESGPSYRVFRGGSFTLGSSETRSATRSRWAEDLPCESIGFRCASASDSVATATGAGGSP
jgi:formylglycine-generating enzyme required for sulfatase activity